MRIEFAVIVTLVFVSNVEMVYASEKNDLKKHKGSMMDHGELMSDKEKRTMKVHMATEEDIKALPNVGNKICPVSDMRIDGVGDFKGRKLVYNGKIYNICCDMCSMDFEKNPQKYINKVHKELADIKRASVTTTTEHTDKDTQHKGSHAIRKDHK